MKNMLLSIFFFLAYFLFFSESYYFSLKCGPCYCQMLSEDVGEALCSGLNLDVIPKVLPIWINRLTLDGNQINSIDLKKISNMYPNLRHISLKNNPVKCVSVEEYKLHKVLLKFFILLIDNPPSITDLYQASSISHAVTRFSSFPCAFEGNMSGTLSSMVHERKTGLQVCTFPP